MFLLKQWHSFLKKLDQLDEENGTDSERQALAFIIRSIKDEKVYATQGVEEMMVNKELSDEICNKISSRIPQHQQIARSQFRKQFKKWLLLGKNQWTYSSFYVCE